MALFNRKAEPVPAVELPATKVGGRDVLRAALKAFARTPAHTTILQREVGLPTGSAEEFIRGGDLPLDKLNAILAHMGWSATLGEDGMLHSTAAEATPMGDC